MSLPESREELLLLHNPRCSKSRAVRELLEARGIDFAVRLYLESPLDRTELEDLAGRLGKKAIEFTRTGQAEFGEAGLDKDSSEEAILAAMARMPILMERPILIRGERARIGRPPEAVLTLLEE